MTLFSKLATLGLCLLITACEPGAGLSPPGRVPVLGGAAQIGLPRGYCIDKSASRDDGKTAVMFLGRCSSAAKTQPALISITVGGAGSAGVMTAGGPALAAFFKSPDGRRTLSRNGQAKDLQVISAAGRENLLLLHLNDAPIGEYWRGITAIRGRLVTISTIGSRQQPLAPAEGRKLLDATLASMQAANRQTP
ncbi:MAG: hypothetical protein ACOH2M_02940 [Cypionkella sp.]